jgi:hypothetical protein
MLTATFETSNLQETLQASIEIKKHDPILLR